jgi:protein-S-isoprenylcysteine O-methyltransferase Ste14
MVTFAAAPHGSLSFGGVAVAAALIFRLVVSAGIFIGLYALGRWLLGFLPALDVWNDPDFPEALSITIGPFTATGPQMLCILAGFVVFHLGRMLVHSSRHAIRGAGDHRKHKPHNLVTEGPYASVRHPMYSGMILMQIGVGVGLHSVYSLAWATVATVIQVVATYFEEQRLNTWVGDEYSDYASKVTRRLFGFWAIVYLAIAFAAGWAGLLFGS